MNSSVTLWRLLEREADWLPPWRDLLRVYRRPEARGDIQGCLLKAVVSLSLIVAINLCRVPTAQLALRGG